MALRPQTLVRSLISLTAAGPAERVSDRDLIDHYCRGRSAAAFQALMDRHGPRVLRVCRLLLDDAHEAEDAFQATFLVLARNPEAISNKDAVRAWLCGVARHIARRMCAVRQRHSPVPAAPLPSDDPVLTLCAQEERLVLDEELALMPEPQRTVLILCYLRGLSRQQAALQLGCSLGTLKRRLDEARRALRRRLSRRGLGRSFLSGVAWPVKETVPARLHLDLAQVLAGQHVPPRAAALAEGVMNAMIFAKWKLATALFLFVAALGVTSALWTHQPSPANAADAPAPAVAQPKPAVTEDWPLFRGNPSQTGIATTALPDQLDILWKFTTKDSIEGTAAIVGGVVYVGCLDDHLYALDLKTGQQKWKLKVGPIKAPLSVKDGLIYVGDLDGGFHCIDAATAKEKWQFKTEGEISSGANFSGDTVLFGSGDEHLYCLSLKDGKERWKFRVPGGPVMGTPAVVADRTFAAGCDSTLHVLDLKNGKELASVDLGGQVGASVAAVGERLYVGTMSNQVLAIDWKKAETTWKYEPEKRPQPFFASAAVTENLVITGSRDKRVHALERKSGKVAWTYPTEGRVDSSPVVVGSRVFVGSLDSKLYVLDLTKGTELKKFDLGSAVLASPAVAEGCLVIGTEKGVVYCFGKKP
jgi:RNA polymerase sigma factor (sigma-70 family)